MQKQHVYKIVSFLSIIAMAVSNSYAQAPKADLILLNGRVWTGVRELPSAQAIAIRGNRILRVGKDREIKKLAGKQTQIINLEGRLVLPGFNDAHIHFLSGALGLNEVDLTGAATIEEMHKRVAEYAHKYPTAAWITGRGWEYTPFPTGLPTKEMLDAVVADRPVFMRAYDGHSGWANSRALQLAGVQRETKFDGFGEIVRDAKGDPTGALKESAQGLVARLIPAPTREQKLQALREGLKLAASLGITSLQNASGSPEELELYAELAQKGELTTRSSVAFSINPKTTQAQLQQYAVLKRHYANNPLLHAGAIKFVLDGVIESHTAAMLEPYSDGAATKGDLSWPAANYQEMVAQADQLGLQIYTHAIGDRAVRVALDAYENAQRVNQRKDRRYRIEHIEAVAATDIPRFAKLGVLASMEPIHAYPSTVEVWSRAVGAERVKRAFAWAELQRNGARLIFSSDWPASISVDPLRGLHNAVNRRTIEGQPPQGWLPEHRVNLLTALRAYTAEGAYASFTEKEKGTIESGKMADVIVLSEDLFALDPMKIHEARVVMTIFDGKVIFEKRKDTSP